MWEDTSGVAQGDMEKGKCLLFCLLAFTLTGEFIYSTAAAASVADIRTASSGF